MRDEVPDEQSQGKAKNGCRAQRAGGKHAHCLVGPGQGDFHADGTQHGTRRHLVAIEAILAEVAFQCYRGQDGTQLLVAVGTGENLEIRRAGIQHCALSRGIGQFAGQSCAELLHNRAPAKNLQRLDMVAVANLIEENVALGDRPRNHHAGETRHGHLVHALGEIPGLIDGDFLLLQRGPVHQPAAGTNGTDKDDDDQAQPYPDVVQSAEPLHDAAVSKIILSRLDFLHGVMARSKWPRRK